MQFQEITSIKIDDTHIETKLKFNSDWDKSQSKQNWDLLLKFIAFQILISPTWHALQQDVKTEASTNFIWNNSKELPIGVHTDQPNIILMSKLCHH